MLFFKPALVNYYEKCGVPNQYAKKTHQRFGQAFNNLASQLASSGSSGDPHALAAVQIADEAFFMPTHYPDGPHWGYLETDADILELVETILAAGICSVAGYLHSFGEDVCADYIDVFTRFLREAQHQGERRRLSFDGTPYLLQFCNELQSIQLHHRKPEFA